MRKSCKFRILCLALCLAISSLLYFSGCSKSNGKNLIYIIGDGMGFNHIEVTKAYMERESLAFEEYLAGEVTTHSFSSAVTDSAAAATALATGVKTKNGYVGVDSLGNERKNLMELSKELGKKTGIVTSDTLDGATPAGFSAHVNSRNDVYSIAACQKKGSVDLLIGKFSSNYKAYSQDFIAAGFQYGSSPEELQGFDFSNKIIGNVASLASPYDLSVENPVSLKSLVEYALDYLSADNDDGFTLMVEGAYIDKYSHSNDVMGMIYALMDLNDTVEYILEWAESHGNTAVIFTADHETGGLIKAEGKDRINDGLYTSGGHTGANVPLYLYGVKTDLKDVDNTDVYEIARKIVQD